jgi:peptide/nickel transport system substrate-binding protein
MRLISLAAAGVAAALAVSGCGDNGEPQQRGFEDCAEDPNTCNSGERAQGGTITWTLDQAATGYFPWTPEGGSVYTLQAVHGILPYFGLFQPDGQYEYNMDVLAAEPQIIGEDPLTTRWQIRDEAVWDDGTPISAEDVIITWKMSTSEQEGYCTGCTPRATGDWDVIENVEGSDNGKTVTVTYKDGIADPEWFAFGSADNIIGGFAPAHVAEQNGFDPDTPEGLGEYFAFLHENPPEFSGGPYLIEEFDLENQVVKVPNPNWYGEVEPTLERVVIRFLTDAGTWVPALNNGELNGASPAGWEEDVIRQVQEIDNVRVQISSGPSWEHLDFNMDNEWLGGDVELRRAIFTVIDQSDLANRIYGSLYPDYTVRRNHVFRSDSEYFVDQLEGTGQGSGDVEAARAILEAAGYQGMDDGAGALTRDGEQVGPFRLRATTAAARVTAQQLIQGYLAEIGIEANIEPTDDLGGTLVSQDYDIIQYGWSSSPLFTGAMRQFWDSESGSNFGNYRNPEVDELADLEQRAATQEESAAIQNQAMEIVVQDAYVLPLFDSPVYVFVTDNYVNVRDDTNSSLRALYEHHEWGVAAQ